MGKKINDPGIFYIITNDFNFLLMKISIIIPTYNEAENIIKLINYLQQHSSGSLTEIIVTDGGSSDNTVEIARQSGANAVLSPQKGRAAQMNYGASLALGDVLYFVHADTFPPAGFVQDISKAIDEGFGFGRYISRYKSRNPMLKINALVTRFDVFIGYGGDQTLFITRHLFDALNGFDSAMKIMEDFDITARAKLMAKYKIIPKSVLISARKYEKNSYFRVLRANYTVVKMYKAGASQDALARRYRELLNY